MDVSSWLHGLGLEHYVEAFSENDIDGEVLPRLTVEDLLAIGVVSIGHRRRLLDAIAALRVEDVPAAGFPAGGRPEPAADTAIPALPEGERRQVAVLFADLAGYTKLTDELDAEEVHALLGRFFGLVDGIVEGYGGSIDKHIGDCVMALFGAPIAHGNDPERAVRAALDIQRRMPGLADELGRPICAHIGVASGQVVASRTGSASRQEYTVTGDSVNLASRLTDRAASGETLISDAVHRALGNRLECAAVGELAVKGLAKPVKAWQLLGFREAARGRQPFVGRHDELHQFEAVLAACGGSGRGQAVYVRGDAGIGKTRLVEEFRHLAAEQGFACHCGLVLDFGAGTGQDAIRSMVRSLLGLSSTSDPATVEATAERAVADGLIASERRVYLNDLLDMPQPVELRALYDAMNNSTRNSGKRATVAELVTRASGRPPLLLVVEDLHWADRLTLDHLAGLTEVVAECPALLVMTSRIEGDPLDDAWRLRIAGSPLLTVDLGPLGPREAEALAGTYLDACGELARRCIERASGNPLFLEQLLLNTEEDIEAAPAVPGSIQSLVLARMDRLDPLDKQALQAASVLGQRFTPDALRHLVERRDYDCACLVRQCLVRPTGEDYLFAHALIQEAVYTSLLRGKRRGLHHRAATWFAGRDPVLHAEHLDRGEDSSAAQAYLDAARALRDSFRYERALALVGRGLELVRDQTATYDLTSLQGELLRDLGSIEHSIEAFGRALTVADDDRQRCRSWIGIAAGQRVVGRFDEALATLDRAEAVAARSDFADDLAEIHHHRGNVYFPMGKVDGCLEQHRLALAQAERAGSREAAARALGGLGDAFYLRGRMVSARDQVDRCVGICRANGYVAIEAANLYMRGITRLFCNELAAGLEDGFAAAELAAKIGQLRAEMVARGGVCALILYELGELDRSAEEADKAWQLARRMGARQFEGNGQKHLGRGLTALGRREEAAALLEEAVGVCRETGIRFMGPEMLSALAVATDDPATRERALSEGEAILLSGCPSHNYLFFYRDAIEASLAVGAWDEAERYAAALKDYTRPEPLPWADFVTARGCALAKWGRGQREADAAAELRRLAAEADRVGLRVGLPALHQALAQRRGAH